MLARVYSWGSEIRREVGMGTRILLKNFCDRGWN